MTRRTLIALFLVPALAGCTHGLKSAPAVEEVHDTQFGKVTGSVFYRERVTLDPAAVIAVELVDDTRADAAAQVISSQNIKAQGRNVPIAFELLFDPMAIDSTHSYAVNAKILVNDKLVWVSDTHSPVLTRGAPPTAAILVKRVGGE